MMPEEFNARLAMYLGDSSPVVAIILLRQLVWQLIADGGVSAEMRFHDVLQRAQGWRLAQRQESSGAEKRSGE